MTTWEEYVDNIKLHNSTTQSDKEKIAQIQLTKEMNEIMLNLSENTVYIPEEILSKSIYQMSPILRKFVDYPSPLNTLKLAEEIVESFIIGAKGQHFFIQQLPIGGRSKLDDDIVTVEKLKSGNMIWSDSIFLGPSHQNLYTTGRVNQTHWSLELNDWKVNFKNVNNHELMFKEAPVFKM